MSTALNRKQTTIGTTCKEKSCLEKQKRSKWVTHKIEHLRPAGRARDISQVRPGCQQATVIKLT